MTVYTVDLPVNCPLQQALAALSGGRILLALEGGYNMRATSEAAAACLGVLLGAPPPPPDPFAAPRPLAGTQAAMQAAAQAQAPHWWAPARLVGSLHHHDELFAVLQACTPSEVAYIDLS